MTLKTWANYYITSSCVRFATCRHGGNDMSLQYIFVSKVYELWIVRVVEAGSNIVYVVTTQVYSRAVMQAVYTRYYIILLSLKFAFYIYAFTSTNITITILCTCPVYYA